MLFWKNGFSETFMISLNHASLHPVVFGAHETGSRVDIFGCDCRNQAKLKNNNVSETEYLPQYE